MPNKSQRHIIAVKRMLLIAAVNSGHADDIVGMGMGGVWGDHAAGALEALTGHRSPRNAAAVKALRKMTKGKRRRRHYRAARRVQVALTQVGVTEHPGGSNSGKDVIKYQRATSLGGTGWPWCVAFVSWVVQTVNKRKWAYRGAGVFDMEHWLSARGKLRSPRRAARPGDIVTFNYGSGHTGIVIRQVGSAHIETVEGNTSSGEAGSQDDGGGVFRRIRPISAVRYFGRP
jgi:hypothetical protein